MVYKEFKWFICFFYIMLMFKVMVFYIFVWVVGFGGLQNVFVREGDFVVCVVVDVEVVVKVLVVEIMLILEVWFSIGGCFVLLIVGGVQQLMFLFENILQCVVIWQYWWLGVE